MAAVAVFVCIVPRFTLVRIRRWLAAVAGAETARVLIN